MNMRGGTRAAPIGGQDTAVAVAVAGEAAAAAGDSLTVAAWTMLSRVTGVIRIAVIAAVLGPTFFGNTYQFTNSLPNIAYYGFLAGTLLSSLLVPSLVRHLDDGDRRAAERVAGGFLGITLVALLLVAPLTIMFGPLILKFAALGGGSHVVSAEQVRLARLLIIMFVPQIFCYGVITTAIAVMNSRKRFALAAGAPTIENIGTIAVLGAAAAIYGTGTSLSGVSTGEMLLLGLGSTGAVALHAAAQWWGARRAGVVLLPRAGWGEPEVRVVARRTLPALAQTGLFAVEDLALLAAANRLPGGVVAFQIALNFYALANAIGISPVAVSLTPRLARMHLDGDTASYRDALVRGLSLAFFITIPAAVGCLVLAVPLASAMSFGRMGTAAGVSMIAVSLVPLSVAILGQTALMIATFACYARKDTRSPLLATLLQTVISIGLVGISLAVHGLAVLFILGLAVSASVVAAACHLMTRTWRQLGAGGQHRLRPSLTRFFAGAAVMAGPAWLTASVIPRWAGPPFGARLAIIAAALVGVAVYMGWQAFWGTREFQWFTAGFTVLRRKAERAITAEGTMVSARSRPCAATRAGRDRARAGRTGQPDWLAAFRVTSVGVTWLVLSAAVVVGAVTAALGPRKTLAGLLVILLVAAVCRWPVLAAYLVIGVTPLTVGLSGGLGLPLIRPNEAVDLLAGAALALRGITRLRSGELPRLRLTGVEWSMLLMAVCNSVIPLTWEMVRQVHITQDDLLYALVMWKLLGLYVIVRLSVSTDRQVLRCLWVSVAAASVVALIAILESLDLLGVPRLLDTFFSYSASGPATPGARASSTLGLPAATADLMIFNLALVSALWLRYRRHRLVLGTAAILFIFATLAAGEFSSAIGLVVGLICIAIVTNSPKLLALFIPVGLAGSVALWPVIKTRLLGFQSAYRLPTSWLGRLNNLRTYFWPKLFSDWNFLLGVRTSARVLVATQPADAYVWIESGYTWLLWGGGIPLLASYIYFVVAAAKRGWLAARRSSGAVSVAGAAVFVAVIVTAVLMNFDPHLTYRGSADAMFGLIALAVPRRAPRSDSEAERPGRAIAHDDGGSTVTHDDDYSESGAQRAAASEISGNGNARGYRDQGGPWIGLSRQPAADGTTEGPLPRGGPSQWPRFLVAHLPGIAAIAAAVTIGAALFAGLQTPRYTSSAAVVVYPSTAESDVVAQTPDMGTEQGVVSSGAVLMAASRSLGIPVTALQAGLSVTSPPNTYLLDISFRDSSASEAQRITQVITQSYINYRTPAHPAPRHAASAAPASAPEVALITPASLPAAASSPNVPVDILAGLLLGIVLGFGFALVRDRVDDHLRGSEDLERQSGARVLALIPAVRHRGRDAASDLVMLRSPGTATADAFRSLRTRLIQAAAWRGAKAILVAGLAHDEEPMVPANLAAALALTGRHVILVCADMRRPDTQPFNARGHAGLTNVLDGSAELASAIQRTEVPGLEILPAGPVPSDPGAVPQSKALPGILDAARGQADFVIIDAPPVLAGPDTSVLAELADMVVLVADARHSTRTEVRAATREVERIHGTLEGYVLVNVGMRRHALTIPADLPLRSLTRGAPQVRQYVAGSVTRPLRRPDLIRHGQEPDDGGKDDS
jgi:putative peptidoglycan lipid II flippase